MLEPELTQNHWSTPEEPLVAEEFAPLDNLEGMPGALREAALGTRAPLEALREVDLGMQHPYMMNSCYSSGFVNILYWIQIYVNQLNSSYQDGARILRNEKSSNLLKGLGVGGLENLEHVDCNLRKICPKIINESKVFPEMFETAAWDDDDGGGPQLSALTWAAARRECVKQENETNSGSNVNGNDKKLKPGKSKKTKLKQGLNDEQEIKGGCSVVQNQSKIELANASQKQKKFKKVKKSAVSEVKRKMITSLDSGVDSPGQERPLLQDSVNGGEDVNVGEDEDICPGGEDEQLEPSSSTNVEVGAILKKGIKFSSAEAFLRFIGLPGKGRRGKKRSLEEEEEEGVKEQKSKKAQKRNVEELNVSSVQEETSDEEEGVENVAFKSDTPVKDAGGKDTSLNMGRLKEHLNNQDSKVKEENAVTQLTKSTPTESPLTLSAKQKLAGSRSIPKM